MRPAALLSSVLLLAATSSAWSNPFDAMKRDISPLLIQRQDDSSSQAPSSTNNNNNNKESSASNTNDSENTSKASATPTSDNNNDNNNKDEESSTSGTAKSTGTSKGSETDKSSITGSATNSKASGSGSKTTNTSNKTKEFDPRLPAGGASMITPDAMSPASYYKIKDQITFAWNYTSLSSAPSAVDVLATCTANNALYTIAANETWEQLQTVVWDTGKYQSTGTIPLLTETYTLIIHDAAKDVSATAAAGYLGTWKQFTFGMYEPQPYTPMADYVCATCSGAMSLMEKQTYAFLFSMAGVTVLTFGWFTGAAGLW
ncbi:hypothetical protein Q7P36_010860 [Cladosporium allicinum]